MPATYAKPWWVGFLVGFVLALLFLAASLWQLGIVAAGVAGFLSGKGRAGAIRGVQAVGPAWIVWLLALSLATPVVDDLVVLMGGILGGGWGLIVLLLVLIPVLMGLFGGLAGGYLAEILARTPETSEAPPAPPPA